MIFTGQVCVVESTVVLGTRPYVNDYVHNRPIDDPDEFRLLIVACLIVQSAKYAIRASTLIVLYECCITNFFPEFLVIKRLKETASVIFENGRTNQNGAILIEF